MLQKFMAVCAAGALVFSFLGWRAAQRAEELASFAAAAAQSSDASSGVRDELTALSDSLVDAGLIRDPTWWTLADASDQQVLDQLCNLLLLDEQHLVAVTTVDEAVAFARTLGVNAVQEAVWILDDAEGLAGYLDDPATAEALAGIRGLWAQVQSGSPDDEIPVELVREVFATVADDPSYADAGTYLDENCRP